MYWINLIGTAVLSMIASYVFTCNVSSVGFKATFTKKKMFIFVILSILMLLNIMFQKDINKVLLNLFISIMINLTIIFDFDYKKSIYCSLVLFIIGLIAEVFSVIILSVFFNFSTVTYEKLECGLLIFTIINTILLITISKLKIIKNIFFKLYNIMSQKLKSFLILIFVFLYVTALSYNNFIILKNDINSLINFGMIIFVLFSSLNLVYNLIQKSKIEDKYNQMLEYVTKYESIINEQGKRNHEFNNQLMVLQGYINNKKKLKEYLGILINDQKGGQNFRIKQLGYLPDGGLKGLLYYKLSKMEENKIKSFLYVSENLKDSFNDMDAEFYSDITKMFGVFIDNAIDAASEAEKKEIVIDIRRDDDSLIIHISNTYKESSDINKIGKKGYTSKGIGHGFGLSIVSDITKKNDKIESFNDIENDMFKQTLIIYLK